MRGVAAHVADEQPLHARIHPEVAGEHQIQAGRAVAGARRDREHADVSRVQVGGSQRVGER